MFSVLALIVPLGFASALSPMMLTEQTVLLSGHDGRRAASRYALGTALVVAVYASALVTWGHAISLPKRPTLSASMDIVAGALLVALALFIHRRRTERPHAEPAHREMRSSSAFGFGVFSMATNFTTLAILVPAAKDIAAASLFVVWKFVLVGVLVVLATMPAWVPVATMRIAPGPAERALTAVGTFISRHGRTLVATLVAVVGIVLAARGVHHVVTT